MKGSDSELSLYSARDCVIQRRLYDTSVRHLKEMPNGTELMQLQSKLGLIADEMTWRGVRVDPEQRKKHRKELTKRVDKTTNEFNAVVKASGHKKNVNPDSNAQMRRLFFDHFNAPVISRSELTDEPSLDEAALSEYLAHPNPYLAECSRTLLKRRKWNTLVRTHIVGLQVDKNGVAHPVWRPGGAVTGRWSSSSPNVMNIPKPVEENRQVVYESLRNMYIPHCKDGWIVEADYSQIELRIVALLAGDEPLLDVFAAGGDPHSANAQDLFYPPGYQGQVTKRERTLAKNFVYLAMYGGNAKKLYTTILPDFPKFTLKKAQILLQNFFRAHPAINQWHADILQQAKNTGRVREPLSGRERVFWGPVNPNEALNYPVQTAAGHIINTAIQDVAKDLSWDDEGVLFQLHDALILDGRDPVRLAQLLIDRMDVPIELNGRKARFPVDVSVGKNWATTEEIDSADTQIVLERVRKLCYD